MTCAAVTKLLVVLLLAFILCLPEFFSQKGLKVSFSCESFTPCVNSSDGECERSGGTWVKGQPICAGGSNGTEQNNSSYWLLCTTQTNLTDFLGNTSLVETALEVSLLVQAGSPSAYNVTEHHHLENGSFLIRHSGNDQGLFRCCMTPDKTQMEQTATLTPHLSSSVSHCFLHAQENNQTGTFYFPQQMKGKGHNVSKPVWLALVLVVLSITVVTVIYQVFCKTSHQKRRVEHLPDRSNQPCRFIIRRASSFDDIPDQLLLPRYSAGDVFSEITFQDEEEAETETFLGVYRCHQKGLSPIHEVEHYEVSDEVEESDSSLLLNQDFTHNQWGPVSTLHHRGHPPTASLMSIVTEDEL